MLFGLASVLASASGQFEHAAWLILWGVLLDKLDGTAARLLGATSEFGVQFDSFADFVVFGVAPAALCWFVVVDAGYFADSRPMLMLCVGAYVVATSARLARFNISEPPGGEDVFFGVATTLSGALLAAGFLTWAGHGAHQKLLLGFPPMLLLMSALMLSNLRIPKLKRRKNKLVDAFQLLNIGLVYGLTPFKLFPEYLLLLSVAYIGVGSAWGFRHRPDDDALAA